MPATRPRIQFNDAGVCNACQWAEEKKTIDWGPRWAKLEELCEKHRRRNKGRFDVIVPYSGGKNGAYIAYTLKHRLGMNPLCVTIRPPMEDAIGLQNIKNFQDRGYDHLFITPNRLVEREIDRDNFINKGIPMHAFMIAVQTAIMRAAVNFDIPFVMFAEEGETEYGGSSKLKNSPTYSMEDGIQFYLSGLDPAIYKDQFDEGSLYWFLYPPHEEVMNVNPEICHWSYFEDFVNYEHYIVAKEKLGLVERAERNIGAIENFSATDTNLIHLYFYMMYLKFGFGRTTSEIGNEIRRGAMTRSQAINITNKFDGEFPEQHIDSYLAYYDMTREEFDVVLDKWANKDLFEKRDGRWRPGFSII
ncbi:MAG: legionaminic acid biosynthesis protein PtmG [Rhodobacteraceae bacterium]|nr:legionaminic acid biosynthesis protein PtmG [Paracoccaceae bacterium]